MTNEDIAVKLTETEARSKSNTHRIDKLEQGQEALNSLAQSVAVMAKEQEHMRTDITETKQDVRDIKTGIEKLSKKTETDDIKEEVEELKAKPGKRWEGIVEKAIAAVVGAVIAFLAARLLV